MKKSSNMKKAFLYSILIHTAFILIIFFFTTFSYKEKEPKYIQLSMEMFGVGEGASNAAKGIETSNSQVNMAANATSTQNSKKNIKDDTPKENKPKDTKKETKKEVKVVKKEIAQNTIKEETKTPTPVKKEEKKEEQKEEQKEEKQEENKETDKKETQDEDEATQGGLMAAKGKLSGEGAGENALGDSKSSKGGVDGVFSLKEVDNVPKSLKSVRPTYPEYARNMRIEGYVQVRFIVNDKGKVLQAKVVKAEPKDVFEQATLDAVKQWKFQPAKKDGQAVNVAMLITLNFSLDEK